MHKILDSVTMKIFFTASLIVFLISTTTLFAFGEIRLYNYGFTKYHINESTGIPDDKLKIIAGEIIEYLVGKSNTLDININNQPLFKEKEIIHMADVKTLIEKVKLAKVISFALLIATVILIFNPVKLFKQKKLSSNSIIGILDFLKFSSLVTIIIILLSGIVLAIAFRPLFYLFHELSFRNDYWQLDPRSDYLVMLFPEGFWIDATLILVAVVFLQAIGILAVVTFFKRLLK